MLNIGWIVEEVLLTAELKMKVDSILALPQYRGALEVDSYHMKRYTVDT